MRFFACIPLLLGTALFGGCSSEDPGRTYSAVKAETVVFVNARVFSGANSPLESGQTLLIDGGLIAAVGDDVAIPEHAAVVDLEGMTVLPGLIDMHAHLYANTGLAMESQHRAYPTLYLAGGVTTIFSPGEYEPDLTDALRERIANGGEVGPTILQAGPYFDSSPSAIGWIQGSESTSAAAEKYELWKDRIDAVKVYTSITEEQLELLISKATRDGKFVTGHLESVPGNRAIALGIDGLEHGLLSFSEFGYAGDDVWRHICRISEVDLSSDTMRATIRNIVGNGVYVAPTIVTLQSMLPDFEPVASNWSHFTSARVEGFVQRLVENAMPSELDAKCMENLVEKQIQFVGALHEAGGIVVAGTDPVLPSLIPGYGLHRELANLVAAGLTPLEAVEAATIVSARILGLAKDRGTIEPGKKADLYVVKGDLSKDIGVLGQGVLVVKNGILHDPMELRDSAREMIGADDDSGR